MASYSPVLLACFLSWSLNLILLVDSKKIKVEDSEDKVTLSDQELDAPVDGGDVVEDAPCDVLAPGDGDAVENESHDVSLAHDGQEGSADAVYVFQQSLKSMH